MKKQPIDFALTVKRPWLDAIIDQLGGKPKNIENRSWLFPPDFIGRRIALHGSKTITESERHAVNATLFRAYGHGSYAYLPKDLEVRPCGAILATAVLAGWVADKVKVPAALAWRGKVQTLGRFLVAGDVQREEWVNNQWAVDGQIWWILRDVATVEPIPARGQLGLWKLDTAVWEVLNA